MRQYAFFYKRTLGLFVLITHLAAGLLSAAPQMVNPMLPVDTLLKCTPPKDTFLLCSDPLVQSLQIPGAPAVPGSQITLITFPTKRTLSACGLGTIERAWRFVRDKDLPTESIGPVCQQKIEIRSQPDYKIRFPADTTLLCSEVGKADTVAYRTNDCNAISVTYTDEKIKLAGSSCFVIYRTHRVINWCEFSGQSAPIRLDRDADRDGKPGDEALWITVESGGKVFLDRDSIPNNNNPNTKGHWTNSLENFALRSRGYWEYQQIIRIVDNFSPVVSVAPFSEVPGRRADCTADVNLSINVEEACTPELLEFTVTWDRFNDGFPDGDLSAAVIGVYPRFRLIHRMPFGKHSLSIRVRDKCGNETERIAIIQVTDGRPPAPKCVNSVVVPLAPLPPNTDADGDGSVDKAALSIRASDLLSSSQFTDCSGPLRYSVHKADQIESGAEIPVPSRDNITLTCDDRPAELLYVYAWDANGNSAYCETFVFLQDPGNNLCPELGPGSISGSVQNVRGTPIEGAKLVLKGDKTDLTVSDKNGQYLFEYLKENIDYSVTPTLDTSYKEGVSTYDIVMIMRHILGEERFTSPFQYLAADADLSGSITTLDVIHIRKLVLCLENALAHKRNFRFLPSGAYFTRPEDVLRAKFNEQLDIKDLKGQILNATITAIKIGDVTGDAFSRTPVPPIIEE